MKARERYPTGITILTNSLVSTTEKISRKSRMGVLKPMRQLADKKTITRVFLNRHKRRVKIRPTKAKLPMIPYQIEIMLAIVHARE
jgi:hypothetical protein